MGLGGTCPLCSLWIRPDDHKEPKTSLDAFSELEVCQMRLWPGFAPDGPSGGAYCLQHFAVPPSLDKIALLKIGRRQLQCLIISKPTSISLILYRVEHATLGVL